MYKKLLKWEYIICIQFFSVYSERCFQMKKIKGFTLAEALLTMTILGVVAAFLIPTIVTDVREHANRARRQAMAVDISNALSHMVMLENRISWSENEQINIRTNEPTGEFIVYHLANYMKLAKICSSGLSHIYINPDADKPPRPALSDEIKVANQNKSLLKNDDIIANISLKHVLSQNAELVQIDYDEIIKRISESYYDCGWLEGNAYRDYDLVNSYSVMDLAQSAYLPSFSYVPWAIKTQNGISMIISYNPFCYGEPKDVHRDFMPKAGRVRESNSDMFNKMNLSRAACLNIVYDVNGATPPNIIGNDVGFATVFFGKKPKVTVPVFAGNYDFEKNYTLEEAEQFCLNNSASGNEGIPTAEEMMSMIINSRLLPASISEGQAKSIVYSHSPSKWTEIFMKTLGVKNTDSMNQSGGVICTYKQ